MNFNHYLDRYFIRQPRLRRFITALLERDEDLDIDIAGAKLRINARREHGYLRANRLISKNGTLRDEIPVLMNLFAILRNGDTFIDVGANTGLFTHSIARLTEIYPDLRIISIEANPNTFTRLSIYKNDRIRFLNLAISDAPGQLDFIDGAVSHVFTTVDKKNSYNIPGETIAVEARRLDDIAIDSNSIVLKIDVEGQERRVLDGSLRLFSQEQIRAVYIDGYDDPNINDFLIDYGFALHEGRTLKPVSGKTFSLLALKKHKNS
jgi:FkbM family methyltransferase